MAKTETELVEEAFGTGPVAPTIEDCMMSDEDWAAADDDGFVEIGRPDIDGWFKAEKGYGFIGTLVASFTFNNARGEEQTAVCVRLERPCKAMIEQEEIILEPGQVLGVGVAYGLTQVLKYVENQGRVKARVLGKKSLANGNSVIKWDVRVKGTKSIPVLAAPLEA